MLSLSGCLIGPDYQPPELPLPNHWSTVAKNGTKPGDTDLSRWWQVFNDPLLTRLISIAQLGNRDLYQAEGRLREARARWQLSKANLLPTSSLGVSGGQTSGSDAMGVNATSNISLDASWEVDVFGKKRRAIESAEASLQAAQEDLSDVLVSLCAEVALNYVDLRGLQKRIDITEANLKAQTEIYELTKWRTQAGLSTELDVEQARLTMENTRASIPSLRSTLEQDKHRIALLLGLEPAALTDLLTASKPIPAAASEITAGIPADLLRQRPDVRRAERRLAAQTAQIGVAEAARYPSFTITGSIGEALLFTNPYTASAKAFQLVGNAALTLLDAGRISSNIKIQNALQAQALGLYQATLLTALRDVENALTAYDEERKRRDALKSSADAGVNALALSSLQYQSGLIDFQRVLDSERALLTAQTQLATSEQEVASNIVRLYKALGGGWNSKDTKEEPRHE